MARHSQVCRIHASYGETFMSGTGVELLSAATLSGDPCDIGTVGCHPTYVRTVAYNEGLDMNYSRLASHRAAEEGRHHIVPGKSHKQGRVIVGMFLGAIVEGGHELIIPGALAEYHRAGEPIILDMDLV